MLERTQKGTMDVTAWLQWFLGCLGRAIESASAALRSVLDKARFWDGLAGVPLNDRHLLVVHRLLNGFDGTLSTSKYARIAKCSQDTAHRDIMRLIELGVLVQSAEGGRSTRYSLVPLK